MSYAPRLRTFFQALRTSVLLTVDSFVRLVGMHREPHVTVIVRLDALGDLFIWLQSGAVNLARHAQENGGRVVLVANAAWADYARLTQLWDEVIPVVPLRMMKSPLYRLRMLACVRRLGAERLIQPRAARVLLQEDAIARISGARVRIGSTGTLLNMTPEERSLGNRFYDRLIEVDTRRSTHELIRNEQFAAAVTGRAVEAFTLPECEAQPGDYVAVALGAGQSGRIWPLQKLAELIMHVRTTHPGLRIAVLGVASDQDQAHELQRQVGGGLENFVGNTDLAGYVRMVARAKLVICNDSSAYHIAMASGRHVVCFLGGGHYGWFAPYPGGGDTPRKAVVLNVQMECYWCNWNCRWPREAGGAFRCVAAIPVQAARAAIDDILGG